MIYITDIHEAGTRLDKFISRCPIFRARSFTYTSDWARKIKLHVQPKKSTGNIFFVPFVAFILNGFPSKVFAMRLLVEFPEKDASQTVIFLLGAVQKNILKARSFHKTKLRHRCLSNSLQILLSFILIVLVIDLLVDLNFKWI